MRFICIFFLFYLLSCKNDDKIGFEENIFEDYPNQISYDFTTFFFDLERKKAFLKGDRARIFNLKKETIIDSNVKVIFFDKTGLKQSSELIADSVKVDDRTKDMIAMGNVVVISDSSETKVETTLLMWENSSRKLTSTEYVKITSPEQIIEGIGFESDDKIQNYTIYKVKGVKYRDNNKQ